MGKSLETALTVGIIKVNSQRYLKHRPSIIAVKEAAAVNRRLNLDIIIGPEWSLMNREEEEGPYSPEELKRLIDYFKAETLGTKTLFIPGTAIVATRHNNIYNLLLAFSDGEIVYATLKNTNGGTDDFDADDAYNLILGKGNHEFKFRGYRIGVEICSDADSLYRLHTSGLDIQLLVSCGIRTTKLAVKKGGYLICADGLRDRNMLNTHSAYVLSRKTDEPVDLDDYLQFFRGKSELTGKKPGFTMHSCGKRYRELEVYTLKTP